MNLKDLKFKFNQTLSNRINEMKPSKEE